MECGLRLYSVEQSLVLCVCQKGVPPWPARPSAAPSVAPDIRRATSRRPRQDHRRLHGAARRRSRSRRSALPTSRRAPACRSRICAANSARRSRSSPPTSRSIDRQVLAGGDADMAEEPPRERLFDVLMRRLEALAPHKAAVRSLLRSAGAQSGARLRAQRHGGALAAMDADRRRHQRRRPAGMMRAQGLALLYRARAAHVDRRRRSRPRPHHGGARPRARRAASAGRASSTTCLPDPRRAPVPRARRPLARPQRRDETERGDSRLPNLHA